MPETSQVYLARFHCATERSARGLVNALLVAGLDPDLGEPTAPEESWEVLAEIELVPTEANLGDLHEAMREAAERTGAVFDGCDLEG